MTACTACIHDRDGTCAVHVCAQVRAEMIAHGLRVWEMLPPVRVAAQVKRKEMAT